MIPFAKPTMVGKELKYIEEAIKGASTKQEAGRGHGLPSIIKILKDMHSNIFIISRKGAIYINGTDKYMSGNIIYTADEFTKLDGTLVSFQIFYPINGVDIYKEGYL